MIDKRPVISIDFDGVLHDDIHYERERADRIEGDLMPGAEKWLEELVQRYRVMIVGWRSMLPGGRTGMQRWLRKKTKDVARHVFFPEIDTRWGVPIIRIEGCGYAFQGTFPSMDALEGIRPWRQDKGKPKRAPRKKVATDAVPGS